MTDDLLTAKAIETPTTIVGIGASAGGLQPIGDLLSRLPPGSGLAALVVQHLSPSHPSLLTEILAKRTPLRVVEARDETVIETDTVYVIPPNTSMVVEAGHLKLRSRERALGPPMPIDDLFESLAAMEDIQVVGVLLSGSGTDGALGMLAIKEGGGVTFTQDDASAQVTSMPHGALALGCVDRVATPLQIADELLRLAARPRAVAGSTAGGSPAVTTPDALRRVYRSLKASCGVDFSHYKRGTVERRLHRRAALRDADTLDAYIDLVEREPEEAKALCSDLLIRYTQFFRDPAVFEALTELAFPRLMLDDDPDTPLRVWVPGCATGEEVYSIAICLSEYLATRLVPRPMQIFGTDISEEALAIARTGRYIENIARNVSPDRLDRYFVREGSSYRIAQTVRECCTFARQNVAYDPPFSRIDLISCRNLLIYLDADLQKRVMPTLHFALRPRGVLMLGTSESAGAYGELFEPLGESASKLFVKLPGGGASRSAFHLPSSLPASAPDRQLDSTHRRAQLSEADWLRRELDRITINRYAPACVLCDEALNVVEFRGNTDAFLIHPPGPPTAQLQLMVRTPLLPRIVEALREARGGDVPVRHNDLQLGADGDRTGSIEVHPLRAPGSDKTWFAVYFSSVGFGDRGADATAPTWGAALKSALIGATSRGRPADDASGDERRRLAAELATARDQMRSILLEHQAAVETLKALEEETQSRNEELQSTNEELETAKEELQSLNEELSTTNDELRFRNRELKDLHEQAAHSRDYADALIETTGQPLLVLDERLHVTRANQAFYDLFRTSESRTIGIALFALDDGQWNIEPLRKLLDEILPLRTQVRDYEVTASFAQIGTRTMQLNARRVAWPGRALVLLTIDDVTERRATMAKLAEADAQKDRFLATLAHELRNPLAAIGTNVALLRSDRVDVAAKSRALDTIERQVGTQVSLVDDLLDASRITRGLVSLRMRPTDLAQVVRHARDGLSGRIEAQQHRVVLTLPATPVVIEGDPVRLEQVVLNLLGNAIKYTRTPGVIEVLLEQVGNEAVLGISDNGIGIPAELLPHVFDIFVQGEREDTGASGGLGIGLALVRRVVELHGGSVQAFSAGPSRGSRFVVRLPAVTRPGALAEPRRSVVRPERAPRAGDRSVLLVDDNRDAVDALGDLLAGEGYAVRIAYDGPSAIAEATELIPDVAIVDIGLPGLDGYQVGERIRALPRSGAIFMIALSGFGAPANDKRALQAEFDLYLVKPPDLNELLAVLAGLQSLKAS